MGNHIQWSHRLVWLFMYLDIELEVYRKGYGVVVTHKPTGWTLFSEVWEFGRNGHIPSSPSSVGHLVDCGS